MWRKKKEGIDATRKEVQSRRDHPEAPRSGGFDLSGQDAGSCSEEDRGLDADADSLAQGVRWFADGSGEAFEGTRKRECEAQEAACGVGTRQGDPEGSGFGKLLSPTKRREAVEHVRDALGRDRVSERRACKVLGQSRSTQRRERHIPSDEPGLVRRMVQLASGYGRYGYRKVTAMLREEGWRVNHKRIERLWRREGLKVPQKQPKRKRLWLNDGSCIRLRPVHKDHVWSYDFVMDRTSDGRAFRMLTLIDEHTRECLAIDVDRKLNSEAILERLSDLFVRRGVPAYLRSDNGPEFTARKVREWLAKVGVKTLYIEPGSPWENGYVESFNGRLRDELLAREQFDTLLEAKVLIERWRRHYNTVRPHGSLGYRPPAPEAHQPLHFVPAAPPLHEMAGFAGQRNLL